MPLPPDPRRPLPALTPAPDISYTHRHRTSDIDLITAEFDAAGAAAAAQAASQPLDGDLTAIAALATTAFGRAFLALADAAAARVAVGIDCQEYDAESTACTGAVLTAVAWSVVKVGRIVTLHLPSTVGAGVAVPSFVYGVALPAAFRPAATVNFICAIRDNGGYSDVPGSVSIASATGVITVYKDQVGTTNFTVTATAGIQAQDFTFLVAA